jgi:hypothetical protein
LFPLPYKAEVLSLAAVESQTNGLKDAAVSLIMNNVL